ncbi:PREDICTED: protein ENHANCED DOWNY MILDEW 2-like isoform X2 [Lupinus angustifolius]|uniref:protein ENHANCED DOWNY MILDEW 2-like isoform X2 n=1 Tax=Lupinus angustifolius TaxID=3871 RepID=UPI00092E96FB|nr:PREDICTED: protein ENHANCED DOWNY MILDEW 2-like isoform X2 [Lupinus angustifolius]
MKKGMANSDDNDEPQSLCLSNYHLDDDNDTPLSFIVLPIKWSESDEDDSVEQKKVFIHGYVHPNRLKKMFPVKAWSFNLSSLKPILSLQTKDGNWIKLKSPRKSFEATIRTILITIHFLHYAKKYPKLSSSRSVWDNLSKVKELSSYKLKPSLSDLLNHMHLISEVAKRDDILAKSKLLLTILEENPGSQKLSDEKARDMMDEANEESEPEDDVCALCDNGGNLVCCDGACKRSFHATVEHGRESMCASLGLTKKEVDKKTFYCSNCEHKQHQCFACGKLGYSGVAKGAEVIQCDSATCYHFYHPHCVAKLLPQVVKHDVEGLERNIADGNHFTCPVHYCCVCKEGENKKDPELQFAVCRRCPNSYHRKCLPREISFDNENDEDIIPRAWEGLLSDNRILIYCLDHEIDDELGTPIRDHIKFPNLKVIAREINTAKEKMKHPAIDRVISKKNNVDLDNSSDKSTSKVTGKLSPAKVGSKKSENIISSSDISRKPKSKETSKRCSFENKRSISEKYKMPNNEEDQPLCALINKDFMGIKPDIQGPLLDADSERRLLALVEEVKSEVTLDSVKKQFASDYTPYSLRKAEKAIVNGKLGGSHNPIQKALRKLEGGCKIQDVQPVCNPDGLLKIVDRLHWYAQNGDTIVDFCCGVNDFSILMKKKLEESGKKCSYKSYDILPTKNNFSFERRDWMTVRPNELPTGSQLIMCLSLCFGTKTALANNFLDKALEFEPKLLLLIVPQEAERLDKKLSSYDLVWEDKNFQSGLSFYVTGSVDVNDKQVGQWNAKPHVLSFWSRRDWTTKHKVIAQEHGHVSYSHEVLEMDTENHMLSYDLLQSTDDKEDQASMDEGKKSSARHGNVDQESKKEPKCMKSKSGKTSRKRKHIEEDYSLPAKRQAVNGMTGEVPNRIQPNPNNRSSSAEGSEPEPVITCPNVEVSDNTRIKEGSSVVSALSGSSGTSKGEHGGKGEEEKQQIESDETEPSSATKRSYKLNHVRMMGSETPTVIRSCTCQGSVPEPGYVARQLSFASGPNLEYSLRHSVGWLDE